MELIAESIDFPDNELINDLRAGMPIAGVIPAVPTLTARDTNAVWSVEEWRKSIPKLNAANVERVVKSQGSDMAKECYRETMKEVKDGWVTEPVPLSAVGAKRPLTPRYAIPEEHWGVPEKIRLVDDFLASGLNDTVSASDTSIPQGLGGFLAMCSSYQRLLNGRELLACSVDFAHAYKHVPLLTVKVTHL